MRVGGDQRVIRTKLVATIGPASSEPARLDELLAAGVDVCRLNFSHGDLEGHARVLSAARAWSAEHERPVAVLGDLCGPKIRLNRVAPDAFDLKPGQTMRIERGDADGAPGRVTVNYPRFVDEVDVGQRVFLDDGLIRLLVTDRNRDALTCTCTAGGTVSSRKGVNLPDTRLSLPALTEKDRRDLDWALENGLDFVALSFVRGPADLAELRARVDAEANPPGVIVKIEMVEALASLDDLIAQCDGVMVARGDLGVQMDVWQVPLAQKSITRRCRDAGKPVIIATQMLQSMVRSPTPTRAEVSDVANAILDAADAVMLSAESASGDFPLASVEMMCRIARAAEAFQDETGVSEAAPVVVARNPRLSAIVQGAAQAALHVRARLVAVWTATGETARVIARHRLPMPVVGLTSDERVWRRLNLLYGVLPIRVPPLSHPGEMTALLDRRLTERGLARPGDLIVVVTSTRPSEPGQTDATLVHRVSDVGA